MAARFPEDQQSGDLGESYSNVDDSALEDLAKTAVDPGMYNEEWLKENEKLIQGCHSILMKRLVTVYRGIWPESAQDQMIYDNMETQFDEVTRGVRRRLELIDKIENNILSYNSAAGAELRALNLSLADDIYEYGLTIAEFFKCVREKGEVTWEVYSFLHDMLAESEHFAATASMEMVHDTAMSFKQLRINAIAEKMRREVARLAGAGKAPGEKKDATTGDGRPSDFGKVVPADSADTPDDVPSLVTDSSSDDDDKVVHEESGATGGDDRVLEKKHDKAVSKKGDPKKRKDDYSDGWC